MSSLRLDVGYEASLYRQIAVTARGVLDGQIGVVEAARILQTIGFELDVYNDELFQYFLEIDSETDHFPIGTVRTQWRPAALAREDAARERYEAQIREEVLRNCELLIQRHARGDRGEKPA